MKSPGIPPQSDPSAIPAICFLPEDVRNVLPPDLLAQLTDDDLTWLEARSKRLNRTLALWTEWRSQQPNFTRWVHTAIRILAPLLRAGYAVPTWELLLDARGRIFWDQKTGVLFALPYEWLERVHEVALALIDVYLGPLSHRQNTDPNVTRRAGRKDLLNRWFPDFPKPEDPDYDELMGYRLPGDRLPGHVFEKQLEVMAERMHWPDPLKGHVFQDFYPQKGKTFDEWLTYLGYPSAPERG